ncbi:response regulator [Kitasatospora sp. NPDC056327]|uniref:response regulator n=1 Tax=Kitasatospora sp. NPDC056327 TaxID=3345785 RepID=UPI0035DE287A
MSTGTEVRVLVADDQDLVREGIASLLGIQPGIAVVATAADGASAVTAAVEHRPDVALLDVRMPGTDGIEAARALAREVPSCRVVMLTTFDDRAYVAGALRAGAVGYLLKNLPSAELARAVRLVHAGVAQLDAAIVGRLAADLPDPSPTPALPPPAEAAAPAHPPSPIPPNPIPPNPIPPTAAHPPRPSPLSSPLSDRETEVLRLVATGSTNREIAGRLHLSEGTVKNHISRILSRLHLRDRTQAALYARDRGLL